MDEGTSSDWAIVFEHGKRACQALPRSIMNQLQNLANDHGGFAVDRLQHSLQAATLAQQDGRDEEYVVCALLHDIGDTLAPFNHAAVAAAILAPFVSEENRWMVEHHDVFQGNYFFEFCGLDPNLRDRFRSHPCFERTAHFCERYDQVAFNKDFRSIPLTEFEPIISRVMSQPKNSIYLTGDA